MTLHRPKVGFFKLHEKVELPKFHTDQAACFDLCYSPYGKVSVNGYNRYNANINREINRKSGAFSIGPFDRLLVPTGLIIDIPSGFSVRIHARSGLSLKQGLVMANGEGVIDSDYVEESFIMLLNISDNTQLIDMGQRLCQAELIRVGKYELVETKEKPQVRTNRNGGFGSTGV